MIYAILFFLGAGASLALAVCLMPRRPTPRPPLVCRRTKLHQRLMSRVIECNRSPDDFNWRN